MNRQIGAAKSSDSLAESLASLPAAERDRLIRGLDPATIEALDHEWRFWARPSQLAPEGEWNTWAIVAGRGAGKTRSGAEWVRGLVKAGYRRMALVAATAADARDVMVEGESGLMSVCWRGDRMDDGRPLGRPLYEPSKRRVTWPNGALATLYSAEEADRLRGPQHEAAWCDELCFWRKMRDTWDMLQFGLRLGSSPRALITTTPKPVKLLREIVADPTTVVSRGSTYENAGNLAPKFLARVLAKFEGTRLGRQELHAEILDEAEGALWSRDLLNEALALGRHDSPPALARVVVAIDPAVTATEESSETGIVVAGLTRDGRGRVLADHSGRYSPHQWARIAVDLYREHGADRIVAETNQGGDMVATVIRQVDPNVAYRGVRASRGKQARAEPIAALYEQGRVEHVRGLEALEDQMATWEPLSGAPSPDRLDALVWAMTDLMVRDQGAPRAPRPGAIGR